MRFVCILFMIGTLYGSGTAYAQPIGTGLAYVKPSESRILYFFDDPDTPIPADSLQIEKIGDAFQIADYDRVRSWFRPELLRSEANLLIMRCLTLTTARSEVVIHDSSSRSYWIEADDMQFESWPVFLLDVQSVISLDPEANPIRLAPTVSASRLEPADFRDWKPVAIQGEWMQILFNQTQADEPTPGWLRWRAGNQLLIAYSK